MGVSRAAEAPVPTDVAAGCVTHPTAGIHIPAPYHESTMHVTGSTQVHGLAIETSGRRGSVALSEGSVILAEAAFSADLRHAVELLPTIDALRRKCGCTPSDIRHCYVSGGPGSFTGVRIGMTVARTLAALCGLRVVRVPTLDVIAENAGEIDAPPPNLGVILDAKRGNVYAAAFVLRDGRYERSTEPAEMPPSVFFERLPRPAALIGEGTAYVSDAIAATDLTVLPDHCHRARAAMVHRLGYQRAAAGDFDDPRRLVPIYIRRPEAEEVWERKGRSARGQ